MIAIYGDDGDRLPMSFNDLTFNEQDGKIVVDMVAVVPAWDWVLEVKAQRDGMESYEPNRMNTIIRLEGMIRGDSTGELFDLIDAVNYAFDPVVAYLNDQGTYETYSPPQQRGYTPLAFQQPTADEALSETGLIDLRYFARSRQLPVGRVSKFEGFTTRWSAVLECVDPRAYFTEASLAVDTGAPGWALDNTMATYPSWPVVSLVADSNASGQTDIELVSTGEVVSLDLDGVTTGQEVRVDFERQRITLDGTEAMELLVAGAEWFQIMPGNQLILFTGASEFTPSITWTPARI